MDIIKTLDSVEEYVQDLEGTIKFLEDTNEQLRDKLKTNMVEIRNYNRLFTRIHLLPFGEHLYNYLTK
jgi:chromosome condensin MukBEF complex kleisin-like MukF subunit